MKRKGNIAAEARKAGLDPRVVYVRMNKGWTKKRALETPVRVVKKPKRKTAIKKVTHKRVAPKANRMIPVEHFVADRTNVAVGWILSTIIVFLITIIVMR